MGPAAALGLAVLYALLGIATLLVGALQPDYWQVGFGAFFLVLSAAWLWQRRRALAKR